MSRVKAFLKTGTGTAILIGLLAITAAYGVRVAYIDLPAMQEKAAAEAGSEMLDSMSEALGKHLSSRDGSSDGLPTVTAWYPSDLPCGAEVEFGDAGHDPLWDALGLERGTKTSFQYRFAHEGDSFTLLARRDSDCDGVYVVHTLAGSTDWKSVLGKRATAQNLGE